MAWDKREVIGLLRMEIENIRKRGFAARFRDTVLCINAGKDPQSDVCSQCLLLQFVPPEYHADPTPCFHIPLNERGDTVTTLSPIANRKELDEAIVGWMERAVVQLQKEVEAERAARVKSAS
jgi:hypothetical protein